MRSSPNPYFDLKSAAAPGPGGAVAVGEDGTIVVDSASDIEFYGATVTDEGDGVVKVQIDAPATPTGTGWTHVTAGVQDAAATTPIASEVQAQALLGVNAAPPWSDMTYDKTTRKISVANDVVVKILGNTYTKTPANIAANAHGTTNGMWYYSCDSAGTLAWSQTAWDLYAVVPLALVYWNNTLGDGIANYELHRDVRDPSFHANHHQTVGGAVDSTGFPTISGYVLGSANDANTKVALAAGVIWDEDIRTVLGAKSATSYMIGRRLGGLFSWTLGNAFPFLPVGGANTYIQYDNAGTLTALSGSQRMNMWVFALPGVSGQEQFLFVVGQNVYTTLAQAQAANISNLDFAGFNVNELAPLYQLTYHSAGGQTNTGKVELEAVVQLSGIRGNIASGGNSIGALLIANNLSDVASATTSRTNLGLMDANKKTIRFIVSSGNASVAIATGAKLEYPSLPWAGTITKWTVKAVPITGQSVASVQFDVWKIASGTAYPTVTNTITDAAKPLVSAGTIASSTSIGGWTSAGAIVAADIFGINIDSQTNCAVAILELEVTLT